MTKDMRNLLDAITWDHKAPEKAADVLTESVEDVADDATDETPVEESEEETTDEYTPLEEAMRNEYVAFMEGEESDEEVVTEEEVGESVSHLITSRENALKRSEERRRAKGLTAKAKAEAETKK